MTAQSVALLLLALFSLPLVWLFCRLTARHCPKCGSKWRTELQGEYGGEAWCCHGCSHYWER